MPFLCVIVWLTSISHFLEEFTDVKLYFKLSIINSSYLIPTAFYS